MSLFDEFKRRKLFKVGGAYLVVAWLGVQAVSIAFPAFDAPPWALRVFILLAMLGFPIALVLAWAFELTPEGLRSEGRARATIGVYVAAGALALLALAWYFKGQPSYRAGEVPAASGGPSIAVLPFANMSGKPDEEYFSDGMTEELLNVLAKIPGLNVAARTSVFAFKGKGGDVREIGRNLGVGHIVEGSVRRDGQQVRVTAQLIRVTDGFHLWSESYDRELKSVFALQDDIARQIGAQLQAKLGVSLPVAARPTIDPAAYDEYLKGRALMRLRRDMPAAIAHFKAALAKAPGFATGWSSLSLAHEAAFWYTRALAPAERDALIAGEADAAEHARTLDPDAAATEHALGNLARVRFQYADAERHYLRGMQIDPTYPDVREDYAEVLFEVGRTEDSLRAARELVTLDPYFVVGWNRLARAAQSLDRRADLEEAVQRLRAIAPDNSVGRLSRLDYALSYGRADEARAALAEIESLWPESAAVGRQLLPWALGEPGVDMDRVRAAIADAQANGADLYFIARQDIDGYNAYNEALGPVLQAYYFGTLYGSRPNGQAMLHDPRAKPMLVRYGFVAYWREKGWPAGCRPLGGEDFECGPVLQ
jgi:TolB-like protein